MKDTFNAADGTEGNAYKINTVFAAINAFNIYTLTAAVDGPMTNQDPIVTTDAGEHAYVAGASTKFDTGYAKVSISSFSKLGTSADSRAVTIKVAGAEAGLQLFGFAPDDLGTGTPQDLWWDITKGGWGDGTMTVDQALALTEDSGTFYAAGTPGTYTFTLQMVDADGTVVAETEELTVIINAVL